MSSFKTRDQPIIKPIAGSLKRFIGCIVLISLASFQLSQTLPVDSPFSFDSGKLYSVERVVDGDTLILAGGTRIRLIGVDTPETVHADKPVEPLGPEATKFVKNRIQGNSVSLRFDRERRDRFHRILAYVYVEDRLLNEELIRAGFSRAETRYHYSNRMKKRFLRAEEDARKARAGLWKSD